MRQNNGMGAETPPSVFRSHRNDSFDAIGDCRNAGAIEYNSMLLLPLSIIAVQSSANRSMMSANLENSAKLPN